MARLAASRAPRRGPTAFAHTPSRLSHSTSAHELRKRTNGQIDGVEDDSGEDEDEKEEGSAADVTYAPHQANTLSRFATPRRNQSIGPSNASPRTPEIHYAPYAASTPPSGLSKSTTIPFDLAASDSAARRLDVELRTKKDITPTPRKKRFVRRKPFFQR